jgi:Domain of unknown function (DUF5615)
VRILLDESLPRPLGQLLTGHDASTVSEEGWTRMTNGALLRQAAERFDVLLTADQNIEFQQNLAKLPLAVVVLIAPTNRLESLEALVPALLAALDTLMPKTLLRLRA